MFNWLIRWSIDSSIWELSPLGWIWDNWSIDVLMSTWQVRRLPQTQVLPQSLRPTTASIVLLSNHRWWARTDTVSSEELSWWPQILLLSLGKGEWHLVDLLSHHVHIWLDALDHIHPDGGVLLGMNGGSRLMLCFASWNVLLHLTANGLELSSCIGSIGGGLGHVDGVSGRRLWTWLLPFPLILTDLC